MKSKTFRKLMADGLDELEGIGAAIKGVETLPEPIDVEELRRLRKETTQYLHSVIEEYMGPPEEPGLGDSKKKRALWPGTTQSPSSIFADMKFLYDLYWEQVQDHEDMDPEFSSLVITSAFMRVSRNVFQKLLIGKRIILERDPGFWNADREKDWKDIQDHHDWLMTRDS